MIAGKKKNLFTVIAELPECSQPPERASEQCVALQTGAAEEQSKEITDRITRQYSIQGKYSASFTHLHHWQDH